MLPDDLRRETLLGPLDLSPDGELVVFAKRSVVGNEYRTALWVVPFSAGQPRQLTNGARTMSRPWRTGEASPVEAPGGHDPGPPTARVPGRLGWREDGTGLLEHPTHVHVVPLAGEGRRLTSASP